MTSEEIKNEIRRRGLKQWEVAAAVGVGEYTLLRWLRRELPPDKRERVLQAIEQLSKERGE